jgi:hypothetical protein
VGIRRPPQWRLSDQVLLDTDRSAPDGQRRGLTLRSRFGRVLEHTAREEFSPAGSVDTAAVASPAWPLPTLRGLPFARRTPASIPTEWEQWLAATRKAITKHAITTVDGGTLNDHQARLIPLTASSATPRPMA